MIEFEEGLSSPESWFRQSWEMYEASRAIYETLAESRCIRSERDNYRRVGLMKGAMLLLGLSLENALKGALVHRSKPDLSNDRLRSDHFHDVPHDLFAIAQKLDLSLDDAQRELLERLTMFVQWASKYQAPLRKAEHKKAVGRIKLRYPSDYNLVEGLIRSLRASSGFEELHGWPCKS